MNTTLKKTKHLLLSSMALLSLNTLAQTSTPEHWYVGFNAGQGYYSNGGNPAADSAKHRDVAGSLFVGYQFNPYFSTFLAYQYLGEASAQYGNETDTARFQQTALNASLGYPLFSGRFTPYIKVGGASWLGNIERMGQRFDVEGFSPLYAAGVAWSVNDALRLHLEHQVTENIGDEASLYADHHLSVLGMSWHFVGKDNEAVPTAAPEPRTEVMPESEPVLEQVNAQAPITQGRTHFANDSSALTNPDELSPVVATLQGIPAASASIIGHTDNTGSVRYNQQLSEKRAQSVVNYFVEQGIASERLSAKGQGISQPIADNNNAQGRAANRRVDVTIQLPNTTP